MPTHKMLRLRLPGSWIASVVLVCSVAPMVSAQTKVSLQPLKTTSSQGTGGSSQAAPNSGKAPLFLPLAGPQASAIQPSDAVQPAQAVVSSGAQSSTQHGQIGQSLVVKEMPRVTAPSIPTLPVAHVTKFQGESKPKDPMDTVNSKLLDVNAMIYDRVDGMKIFSDLQTDRKYFESASMAEPTRVQDSDISPYLWNAHGYCWVTPTVCYSPLYFEQPNFERYGQGAGHPFASTSSAVHFVGQVATLPVAMVCTPPWQKSCTLGHHRPGDCAPYQRKTTDH